MLRNDHHCIIVNACIGFGNQRFFIPFLFWGVVGIVYAITWQVTYIRLFGPIDFFPFGWAQYIAPFATIQCVDLL